MSNPYVGEIRMFAGNFAPYGWALCDGRALAISQNDVLFNLIGTTYGGDGITTFNLPDLRGRVPLHFGNAFVQGEMAGEEAHRVLTSEIPSHNHTVNAVNEATTNAPASNLYAGGGLKIYKASGGATLNNQTIQNNSGSQPHQNMMPYLAVNFIISLFGIYPSRN